MADGIRLGGAFFEFEAENAQLLGAFVQSQAKARQASDAIRAAVKAQTDAIKSGSDAAVQAAARQTQAAQGAVQAAQQASARYQAMAQSARSAGAAVQQSNAQLVSSNQRVTMTFGEGARAALGFATAVVGVQTGAAALNAMMGKVAESTRAAGQAQFALNALYGQAAPIITRQSEELAKASGRSRTEALEAATAVANLGRQYALTFEQQRQVMQISANLAAVRGIPLEEATKRVSDAIRGEAEAAEYLGQVLNSDAVKAFANMTEEQRRLFESLSPVTKAQIVLGKLIEDNADLMDQATKRAESNLGAFDKLSASTTNLAGSIGEKFLPHAAEAARQLNAMAEASDRFFKSVDPAAVADFVDIMAQIGRLGAAGAVFEAARRRAQRELGGSAPAPDATEDGPIGPSYTPEIAQAVEDARRRRIRDEAEEKDRIRSEVERQKRAIGEVAEAREKALRAESALRDKAIEQEKIRLEVERAARLKALEQRQRDTIAAIEAEQRAAEKASERAIELLEREKKARTDAAEQAAKQAKDAIDARKAELGREREIEDRVREDSQRSDDRALDDARRRADQQRDDLREREDRSREDAHERELRRIEERRDAALDAIDAEIDALEKKRDRAIRAIERQADAARSASDRAVRQIEAQAEAENERHRAALQNLKDEEDARLRILDAQLAALDAEEQRLDNAKKTADLETKVADARKRLSQARGTGDATQVAAAQQGLFRALATGNQQAIEQAQADLKLVAGEGAKAVEDAAKQLAEAEEALRKEGLDQKRDAEREKLETAKDAIRAEIDTRKRAEDEENRRRERELAAARQAEQDKLKSRLDALEEQKRKTEDATKSEIASLQERRDAERKASEESERQARDEYARDVQRIRDLRQEEDRARDEDRLSEDRRIADSRRAEDQRIADSRRAQDDALAAQQRAVEDQLKLEREAIDAHYNGPTGVITRVRTAMDAAKEEYRKRLEDAQTKFRLEREALEAIYRNEAKNGLIDLQDEAARNNAAKLSEQLGTLASWKQTAGQYIDDNKDRWTNLRDMINEVNAAIGRLPNGGFLPPGGTGPLVPPGFRFTGPGSGGSGGGSGSPSKPPSVGGTTPAPITEPPPGSSGEVDVSRARFIERLGFAQPYNGEYQPGPGWEGGAAWAGGPSHHKGVDLLVRGAKNNGKGQPIGAFTDGTIVQTFTNYDPSKANSTQAGGRYVVIEGAGGRTFWYLHLDSVARSSGPVRRGDIIGTLGETGTEGYPHLHFEVRNGLNNGPQSLRELRTNGIDPTTYMRDSGYVFREPTLTLGLRSGERNLLAERGPERLLGRRATESYDRMGMARYVDRTPLVGPVPRMDYAAVGEGLATIVAGASSGGRSEVNHWSISGVGMGEVANEIERRQRRKALLSARRL